MRPATCHLPACHPRLTCTDTTVPCCRVPAPAHSIAAFRAANVCWRHSSSLPAAAPCPPSPSSCAQAPSPPAAKLAHHVADSTRQPHLRTAAPATRLPGTLRAQVAPLFFARPPILDSMGRSACALPPALALLCKAGLAAAAAPSTDKHPRRKPSFPCHAPPSAHARPLLSPP